MLEKELLLYLLAVIDSCYVEIAQDRQKRGHSPMLIENVIPLLLASRSH